MKKVISWEYFKADFNTDREFVRIYSVDSKETEKAIKEAGFIPSDYFSGLLPGVKLEVVKGFTSKAQKYGNLKKETEEKYPNKNRKFPVKNPNIGQSFGNLVYAELPSLDNVNQTTLKKLADIFPNYIYKKGHYISLEAFNDKDFLQMLLEYSPVIDKSTITCKNLEPVLEYKKSRLPKFIKGLKYNNPQIFNKLKKDNELYSTILNNIISLEELNNSIGYTALVHTLKKGPVKLIKTPVLKAESYWNGKTIEISVDDYYEIGKLEFTPDDDYVVIVLDNDTVTESTIFTE